MNAVSTSLSLRGLLTLPPRTGFGPRYTWHVGNVIEVNKKRTKSENVSVAFYDAVDGETRGGMVADPQTYGAIKLWVVLKPIPL